MFSRLKRLNILGSIRAGKVYVTFSPDDVDFWPDDFLTRLPEIGGDEGQGWYVVDEFDIGLIKNIRTFFEEIKTLLVCADLLDFTVGLHRTQHNQLVVGIKAP